MASLADSIAAGVGSLIVFNPLNWKRDGEVTIDLDKDMEIADQATKQTIPYVVLHEGASLRRVEFRATEVPAAGYKVYELRNARAAASIPQKVISTTIESPFYRVELNPSSGSIRSIYDKELVKELVDTNNLCALVNISMLAEAMKSRTAFSSIARFLPGRCCTLIRPKMDG